MRILYYDCFCGISGDMNLGALLDLGVDESHLRQELAKLPLEEEYQLHIEKGVKKGICGTRVEVKLAHEQHHHGHDHHHHAHQAHPKEASHTHRRLQDIRQIIEESGLSSSVKRRSLAMFHTIAAAEAKVHGKSLEEVHFHEVGATDSIVDLVGAAICLETLQVDKIMASTIQLGGGFVKCAHGVIPVPAPATVEILKGIPVKTGIVAFETTTPTGAAILATNVQKFTDSLAFSIEKIGYGIGHRELEIPNVLRVYLGVEEDILNVQEQYILETNIDDMNPEFYSHIEETLFAKGALDVFKTSITMKKGRPAVLLSVLVEETAIEPVMESLFKETSSLGVRKHKVEKVMLQRDFTKVQTRYGTVAVKNAYYQGKRIKYKAEYEDCVKIARERELPLASVYQEVYRRLENEADEA